MNDTVTVGANSSVAILILRLSLGILILFHGVAKILHGIGPIRDMVTANGLPEFVAYGVYLGEVVGPLLLIAGFYARAGAGLIAVNMVFALALAHAGDLFSLTGHGGWRLELQGMYLITALVLVLTGPGRFSINQR